MGRLQAMHLARRLPYGAFAEAAYAGLQDTAPRAALLSLHARMDGVGPDTWEHPVLVQVWGPRDAVWLVHRDARAAFTVGRLPRDPRTHERLHALADQALAGAEGPGCRAGAVTGRFVVRWDARTTRVIPAEPPDADPEDARVDLARRFLGWFGEELRPRFAAWARVSRATRPRRCGRCPPRGSPHGRRRAAYGCSRCSTRTATARPRRRRTTRSSERCSPTAAR